MRVNGFISTLDMSEAVNNPPEIKNTTEDYLDETIVGHIFDHAAERAQELIGKRHLDLVIQVTIDPELQNQAKSSIEAILDKESKRRRVSETALISTDNETGAILAMVGGRDYNASKFNRAIQAKRQPGSSFKTCLLYTSPSPRD